MNGSEGEPADKFNVLRAMERSKNAPCGRVRSPSKADHDGWERSRPSAPAGCKSLGSSLRRAYQSSLSEPLSDEMVRLLRALR